jgi:DnaK suppressor protein
MTTIDRRIHATPSRLSAKQREELRNMLLQEQTRLTEEYRHDVAAAQEIQGDRTEDLEELATMDADRERLFAHSEQDCETLRLIEEALQRMAEGTYGFCQESGEPIPFARLRRIPWAHYRTGVQEKVEGRGVSQTAASTAGSSRTARARRQQAPSIEKGADLPR